MWQEEQRLSRFDDGAVRMRRQNEAVHSNIAAARRESFLLGGAQVPLGRSR